MLDFTSALYLGFRHPSRLLRPWAQLTLGVPAALTSPPGARLLSERLAALQGCEAATLSPSTLHLFWDLFGMLARGRVVIYLEASAYPIARWGVERAAARGVPVRSFPHHDVEALRRQLTQEARRDVRPVLVTDGFCPGCGTSAPLAAYLGNVRVFGGYLILDDTQALGLLGLSPGPHAPYGKGGGGSLRWSGVGGADVLVVSSLAKGFGVPMAALSGSHAMVRAFEMKSETRVHSSPPSIAVIYAAERALALNRQCDEVLRLRLIRLVRQFRTRLAELGFSAAGGLFPVQTLAPLPGLDVPTLHTRLLALGVRTVQHAARNGQGARISFLITARHRLEDIDRAVHALSSATQAKVAAQWS